MTVPDVTRSWQGQQEHPRAAVQRPRSCPCRPQAKYTSQSPPPPETLWPQPSLLKLRLREGDTQVPFPASGWPGDLRKKHLAPFHFSQGRLCIESLIKVQQTAPPEPNGPKSFNPQPLHYCASVPDKGKSRWQAGMSLI